ncbi:gp16 family protein [Achromobacter insolitus]|uniref:gp16 family protein n=1 Tax=Achromobacter insolitus TaxID=217204 RepID=UPI001EED3B28|nr:regulatory protein GemA [Achromobacter insolitus]
MAWNKRASLIKLLHVARRSLGMDEDAYRQALVAATGKASASAMTLAELEKALSHFKRCGFVVVPAQKAGRRPRADSDQARLIRHLWLSLHGAGAVRDPSEAALAAWVKRETGVDAVQWLDIRQAGNCIEKLKNWIGRL